MTRIATTTLLFITLTIFISCKKDKRKPEPITENETGTVMISGLEYPTVKIGNLIWTRTITNLAIRARSDRE